MTNPITATYKAIKALYKAPRKQYRNFLLIIAAGQVAIIMMLFGIDYSQSKLSNWMYKEYTEPFLAHAPYIVQK